MNNSGLQWDFVNEITTDKFNNLWFANEAGVSKFDGSNWVNYDYVTDSQNLVYNVRDPVSDSNSYIWLATTYSVIKLDIGQNK